jgi:Putative Flp pilus-assembly TadE/G-like
MPHSGHTSVTSLRPVLRVAARGSSRGQAFVFLLPLLAALAAAFLLVFDSGQAVSEKQRLVNAADAAALGAATWQARALNFESYMNRAVIANEAAIAQSVSLRSWSAYMNRLLPGAAALSRWVPFLNAATLALQRIWAGFDQVLQPGLTALEGLLSVVDHDLAGAQRFVHAAALLAVPEVVRGTLAANDPRFRLSRGGELLLARWSADWVRFTSFYGGAFRWRQADVLRRSMDGFSDTRGVTFDPLLVGALVRFEKRGGTDLLDFETWRGMDTLSMHARSGLLIGRMREQLPLGWGGAENGEISRLRGVHGGSPRVNPRASRLATLATRRQPAYLGLPSLRDVSVAQRDDLDPPRLVVRAAMAAEQLVTSPRAMQGAFVPDLRGRRPATAPAASASSFAMAAAEVRFVRPVPRADGARELGSLYNPYWRPRLAATAPAERAMSAAADGVANPVLDALP